MIMKMRPKSDKSIGASLKYTGGNRNILKGGLSRTAKERPAQAIPYTCITNQ